MGGIGRAILGALALAAGLTGCLDARFALKPRPGESMAEAKEHLPQLLREAAPPTPEFRPGDAPMTLADCVQMALKQGQSEDGSIAEWRARWMTSETLVPSDLSNETRQIWFWKRSKRYRLLDSARYAVLLSRLKYEDRILGLIQDVESAYWDVQVATRLVGWWAMLQEQAVRVEQAAEELFRQGQLTRVQRARVAERSARIRQDQLQAQIRLQQDQTKLKSRLGLSPEVELRLEPLPETVPLPELPDLDADVQHIVAHATPVRMFRVESIFNNQARMSRENRMQTMFERYLHEGQLHATAGEVRRQVPQLHAQLRQEIRLLHLHTQERQAVERRVIALQEIARENPPGDFDAQLEAQRDRVLAQESELRAMQACYRTESQLNFLRSIGILRYAPNEAVATAVAGENGRYGCAIDRSAVVPELYRMGCSDAEVDESILPFPQR
ncbi:TolC family protein [Tuwongella immobilis]|nr:TolC family protein [Tuwongella immobilis]